MPSWPEKRVHIGSHANRIDAPMLSRERERTVRYYGGEVAAVAGTTKQAWQDALRANEVEAKELPFVVKEEEARDETSPRVWDENPNLSKPGLKEQGEVDK